MVVGALQRFALIFPRIAPPISSNPPALPSTPKRRHAAAGKRSGSGTRNTTRHRGGSRGTIDRARRGSMIGRKRDREAERATIRFAICVARSGPRPVRRARERVGSAGFRSRAGKSSVASAAGPGASGAPRRSAERGETRPNRRSSRRAGRGRSSTPSPARPRRSPFRRSRSGFPWRILRPRHAGPARPRASSSHRR